ncbi:MAG: glycoside hydrolase family 125 protein [Armatimonadota bacterium]
MENRTMNTQSPSRYQPFASFAEALSAPQSAFFGLAEGRAKRAESHYQSVDDQVSFDVSNNQILCCLSATGLPMNACVLDDVVPGPGLFDNLPGVLAHKELIGGGPWPFSLRLDTGETVRLHDLPGVSVALLGGLFPRFTFRHEGLLVQLLVFAPAAAPADATPPRAVVVVTHLGNETETSVEGALISPPQVPDLSCAEGNPSSHEAIVCLDGTGWSATGPEVTFSLKAGESASFAFGLLMGGSGEELRRTGQSLAQQSALSWFNETWRRHTERLGRLSIPEAPYDAEAITRFRELCRQSVLRQADGKFGGGFWGSDFIGVDAWASARIWNKDNFHAMLPLAMLDPDLCRDAIPFFLRWGLAQAAYGPAVRRFPNAKRITHSLANALSPLVLAGAYYQMTGDQAFFRSNPGFLAGARDLLRAVLETQQGKTFLFPSLYISDGESRGDYHTGSNLLVWYAFTHMARLAREVYDQPALADEWAAIAGKVKEALLAHCVGACSLGKRFLEGADADGTWVTCHDGEETDVALMPFYGFCEPDDPALLNHSRLAVSPENPFYAPGLEGIWWGDHHQPAATFPGWMTGLAGASTEDEVTQRLELIRRLTDHDGSIWWWPYQYPETDPTQVRRRDPWFTLDVRGQQQEIGPGKSGWAAGVYLCLFVHNILGIRVDVPARQVALRPFCPWPEFSWTDCRLGSSRFDFEYRNQGNAIEAGIVNRNEQQFEAVIELNLPDQAAVRATTLNGRELKTEATRRYSRPAVRCSRKLKPGGTLTLKVEYGS